MGLVTEGKVKPEKKRAGHILGESFYEELIEIKDNIQLDKNLFGFFSKCFLVNKVLARYNFFLKLFEQREKFRFLVKRKVEGKNKVTRDLSSSIIEKINGYEIIKNELARKEKRDFTAIDIVYRHCLYRYRHCL